MKKKKEIVHPKNVQPGPKLFQVTDTIYYQISSSIFMK